MGGAEREVGEERPIRTHTLRVGDHLQCLVDQIGREVVALVGRARRVDRVVVGDELGVELVGLAIHEAVEPVEATRQRPLIERPCGRAFLHRGEVPLADREGGVALVVQYLRDRGRVVRDVAQLVGEPGDEVGHGAHADRVVGTAGEQCRARGRAQRRHVEVGELQPSGRQRIDVGRVDVGAEAAELREAGVVEQHDDHVRGAVGGVRSLFEVGLGLRRRSPDATLELLTDPHVRPFHQ